MKFLILLCFLISGVITQSAQDFSCDLSLVAAATAISNGTIPSTQNDISVILNSGKQIFDMGSKEQCDITPGVHYMIATLDLFPQGYIGVCVYQNCTAAHLTTRDTDALKLIASLTNNTQVYSYKLTFYDKETNDYELKERQQPGYEIVTHFTFLLVVLTFVGMAVELTRCLDRHTEEIDEAGIPRKIELRSEKQLLKSKNNWGLFFLSFSLNRNLRKLLSTKEGGGDGFDGNLEVFAGVRTLSMMYVILGHINLVFIIGINSYMIGDQFKSTFGTFVQGGYYAVDAFFCMAGFLATYVMLGKLAKSRRFFNIGLAYFHRWYRLAPALIYVLLLCLYVFPYIIEGPVAFLYRSSLIQKCNQYWWTNILFLNNLYPWKFEDECMGWTWYLANDFDFFLITPFILFVMHKSKRMGLILNAFLIVGSIVAGIAVTYSFDFTLPSGNSEFQTEYYGKPWCRLASYEVGVLLAQLYYDRKLYLSGNQEAQSTLGNRIFELYNKSALFAWISVFIGVFLTSFMIFIYQDALESPSGWSIGVSMLYNGFARPLFVLGMMMALFPTFEGRLPWLRNFMANGFFRVMGRLTYSAYLIHFLVLAAYVYSINSTNYFSRDFIFTHFLGLYCLTYASALVVSLLMESPFLTIEKALLFPSKPTKSERTNTLELEHPLLADANTHDKETTITRLIQNPEQAPLLILGEKEEDSQTAQPKS